MRARLKDRPACRPKFPGRVGPLQFPRQPSGRSTSPTPEGLHHPLQDLRCLPWPSPNPHRLGSLLSLLAQESFTTLQTSLHAADRSFPPPRFDGGLSTDAGGSRWRATPWRLPGPDSEGYHPTHPEVRAQLKRDQEIVAPEVGVVIDDLLDRHARGEEVEERGHRYRSPRIVGWPWQTTGPEVIRSSLDIEIQRTGARAGSSTAGARIVAKCVRPWALISASSSCGLSATRTTSSVRMSMATCSPGRWPTCCGAPTSSPGRLAVLTITGYPGSAVTRGGAE